MDRESVDYEAEAKAADPPEGFSYEPRPNPFGRTNGPIFVKRVEEGACRGFRVMRHHCNGAGIVHGGMLMSLADGLLGEAAARGAEAPTLTIRMTSDFLSMARPGDWIEGRAWVVRRTRSVMFVQAELKVGERSIFAASGLFKVMRPRRRREPRDTVSQNRSPGA